MFLQVTELRGNPPLNATWQIVTDIGHPVETGQLELSPQCWDEWPAGPDNDYLEKAVAATLGVALAE